MSAMIEKAAEAMWERNLEICRRTEADIVAKYLLPWADEAELLRDNWRELASVAIAVVQGEQRRAA